MTTLAVQRLSPDVAVAPQLTPEAMAEAAAQGFRSVINNRPDFEGGADQPTSAAIEAAARAAGLEYRYLPVASGFQSADEIASTRSSDPALITARQPLAIVFSMSCGNTWSSGWRPRWKNQASVICSRSAPPPAGRAGARPSRNPSFG